MTMAVARAFASLSKFLSKFFHDGLPVALASVLGAMLVGQYNRAPASSPIIVQAPPEEQRMAQALSDEHELIVDYLKRDAEANRAVSPTGGDAPAEKKLATVAEERPAKARFVVTEIAPPRPAPKRIPERKAVVRDPMPLVPSLDEVAPPPTYVVVAASPPSRRGLVIGAVRGLFTNAVQLPARLWNAVDRPTDDGAMPRSPLPHE
jgi:hypothetical protein